MRSTEAVLPKPPDRALRVRQRQKLIEACITALHQHGPSRTTIDKVVTIADMSPGIVNFYFDTKAALLVAALDHLATEFEERVLTPLAALQGDPAQALRRLIDLYLDPDIASARKISVWYAFWGEASSRAEYLAICGKRDAAFADLVRRLMARLITQLGAAHLDADAVALGLIGALEVMWQDIAFHEEGQVDRHAAARRCTAYLQSLFPAAFSAAPAAAVRRVALPAAPISALSREACKMLIAAELCFAGIPAFCVPQAWPGCDIVAHPPGRRHQTLRLAAEAAGKRGAVLACDPAENFDFLAIVRAPPAPGQPRRWFLIPREKLLAAFPSGKLPASELEHQFIAYEGNHAFLENPHQ